MTQKRLRQLLTFSTIILAGVSTPQDARAEEEQCMNGGPGATSCSYSIVGGTGSGCSVTCNSGYYACCTLSGCHCVAAT